VLKAHGDLAGARQLQERVLEVRRLLLGEEHPDTFLSEWNLLMTVLQSRDFQNVIPLVEKLSWLLKRDPETLGATHRQIREMLAELELSDYDD